MKLTIYLLLLPAFLCLSYSLVAQDQLNRDSIDILLQKIKAEENPSLKIQYAEDAVEKAEATEIDSIIIECRNTLAMLYYNTSQFEKSGNQRKVLRDIQMPKDSVKGMTEEFRYGTTYIASGEYAKGIPILKECADWFLSKKEMVKWTSATQNIAVAYTRSGKTDEAIELYLDILPIQKERQDTASWINALTGLGRAFFNTSDYKKSEKYYKQALELCLHPKFIPQRLASYNGVANNFANREQHDSAKIYFSKIVTLSQQRGDTQRWATALGGIGWNYIKQDSFQVAKLYLEEAFEIYKNGSTDNNLLYAITKNLSKVYLEENQCEKGIELLNTAYPVAKENKDSFNLHRITYYLTKIHICLGNHAQADRYFEEYNTIDDALFQADKQGYTNFLAENYDGLVEYKKEKTETEQIIHEMKQANSRMKAVLYSLIPLVIVVGYFMRKRYQKKMQNAELQQEVLQKENEEIKLTVEHLGEQPFFIETNQKRLVKNKEVLFVTSSTSKNYTEIYFVENNDIGKVKKSLTKWGKELDGTLFVRAHNQFLVNLMYVETWKDKKAILTKSYLDTRTNLQTNEIPIGGTLLNRFEKSYGRFKKLK